MLPSADFGRAKRAGSFHSVSRLCLVLLAVSGVKALGKSERAVYPIHRGPVTAVAWTTDSAKVVSCGWDGRCRMTGTTRGETELVTTGIPGDYRTDRGEMHCLSWNEVQGSLAIAQRYRVLLVDPLAGRIIKSVTDHQAAVRSLSWSPDFKLIATNSEDGSVRLWDPNMNSRGILTSEMRHSGLAIAWSRHSKSLAVDCLNRIAILKLEKPNQVRYLDGYRGNVLSLDWSGDDTKIVSGSEDGAVRVWDVATGRQVKLLKKKGSRVNAVAWSKSGNVVAFSDKRRVRVVSANTWEPLHGSEEFPSDVRTIAIRLDEKAIAVGCLGGEVGWFEFDSPRGGK